MKQKFTELRICDLAKIINSMCPVRIYINGKCKWNDDENDTEQLYQTILNSTDLVYNLKFKIVHFHHSYVYIKTLKEKHNDNS